MLKVEMRKAFIDNNQDTGCNNQVISNLWALYMQNRKSHT